MFPAFRLKARTNSIVFNQDHLSRTGDSSDWSDGNSGDTVRNALVRASCEEQFVVLAAVQREMQIDRSLRITDAASRDALGA
jgi:hypothetical protein